MRRYVSLNTDTVCAFFLMLHCCSMSTFAVADAVWTTEKLPCPPALFNYANWSVNTSYILQDCSPVSPGVFNVSLPSQPFNEHYYGNIGITVIGECLLPRIIINTTSNTDTITAGNISVVLRNVNFQLNVPSASSGSGTVLGTSGQRLGGLLMCIIAQSWHNISLSIINSNIAVIGPGWLFNWDSSVNYRISALLSLSSTASSGAATTSSEGLTVIVSNSTLNISEVAGVSVMFLVDHVSSSAVPLSNLYLRIDFTSTVAFSTYNNASMCDGIFKDQLSSQAIFLVEGPGNGAALANVSCLVEASRIVIWYMADAACKRGDRTESGVAIVRSFSMVQQVYFIINQATSVTVRMYMAPNGDVEYASRAMVFGITSGGVVQNITGIANCSDGSRADVRGSDYASLFMFNALSSVAYSTITIANMDVNIATTALSTSTGRTSSVLLLELVDLFQHSLVTISSLNASVYALPGNDTALLAVASSLFYQKGGMLNASVAILQCVMYGSNTDGRSDTPFLMISVAAVLFLAWDPSYNITTTHILLSNVRVEASIECLGSNPLTQSLSSASIGLICAPLIVTSSEFNVGNCAVTNAGVTLGSQMRLSTVSVVLSSAPLPLPSELLYNIPAVHSFAAILSSIQNSIYKNVTVIIQSVSLVATAMTINAINDGSFVGSAVFILPLLLSDGSNVTIRNCNSLQVTEATSGTAISSVTFFSSALLTAVTDTVVNGSSHFEASDCINFAHCFVAILGNTKVASNVTIVMKRVALEAQRYSAEGSQMSNAPIVAQITPMAQTSLTFDTCSSLAFETSNLSGFTTLVSTSVNFPSQVTAASCTGNSLVLSCCHWKGKADVSSSLIYSPLFPALKGIPKSSVAIHNDEHCDASHTMSHFRPPADHDNGQPSLAPTSQQSLTIAGGASSIAASVSLVLSAAFSGGVAAADFQVLALLGLSPCAPSNLQSATSISKYIVVSPFYDLGDEAQILGNIGLILFVVVLQMTSQYVLPDQLLINVAPSSPQTTWGNIVSHLQRFPRYSVMIGIVLIPGIWRSALSILVSGGGSEGAISQGTIGARLSISVFGCASVAAAAVWRWRESSLLDRWCAARGGAKVTSLAFYKYHERVFRKHSVFVKVPRWMLPCGFWGPEARRLTHGPLRNVIRGGVDASTAVLHMSAYPVVVTVLVATAISIPHADNANQSLCIASWALVSVIYSAAGVAVMIIRPGRCPLSDVMFAALMCATTILTIIAALQSSKGSGEVEGTVTTINALSLIFSLLASGVSFLKTAHECYYFVWEWRVWLSNPTMNAPATTPPRSPTLTARAEEPTNSREGKHLRNSMGLLPALGIGTANNTTTISPNRSAYILTTQLAQLETLIMTICENKSKK